MIFFAFSQVDFFQSELNKYDELGGKNNNTYIYKIYKIKIVEISLLYM